MSESFIQVAVGIVVDQAGQILIAKRPEHVHQGGLWEFPGGKLEGGESVHCALVRELQEELAITVVTTELLLQIHHDYGDKKVCLNVHNVTHFTGIASGNEGQQIAWVSLNELHQYSFPSANHAIITALTLPDRMLVTGAADTTKLFLRRLELALQKNIRLVQLRCPRLDRHAYLALVQQVQPLSASYNAQLLLNTTPEIFAQVLAAETFLNAKSLPNLAPMPHLGLHLNSNQLQAFKTRPIAKKYLLGASCHNLAEITQARNLDVDYILLSPVAQTTTHPNVQPLGWNTFAELLTKAGVPVFALGGMQEADLPIAKSVGAHGIAAISCWW